ncbi:MAG: hypothetical protein GY938_05025 [Ketobacter sp.]|nr:hypothetical protein [Ketobacter sp.]
MAMTWTVLTSDKDTEGSIKNWVNHASVPSTTIVTQAEALIFQRLRVLKMLALLEGTLAADATDYDISSLNYLSPKSFYFYGDNAGQVTFRNLEMFEISRVYNDDTPPTLEEGTPSDYTHDRSTIYFNMKADAIHYFRHWYYAKPVALSGSNETNLLTDEYPHLLLAACLARAYKHRKDEARAKGNLEEMIAYIDQAMVESDMALETSEYNMYWNQDGNTGNYG